MSAGYALVYGARDEGDARALVAEALRQEADKALAPLAEKIAKAVYARRQDAVTKAGAIDSRRLDAIAADLAEIVEERRKLKALAARVTKAAEAATNRTDSHSNGLRMSRSRRIN